MHRHCNFISVSEKNLFFKKIFEEKTREELCSRLLLFFFLLHQINTKECIYIINCFLRPLKEEEEEERNDATTLAYIKRSIFFVKFNLNKWCAWLQVYIHLVCHRTNRLPTLNSNETTKKYCTFFHVSCVYLFGVILIHVYILFGWNRRTFCVFFLYFFDYRRQVIKDQCYYL